MSCNELPWNLALVLEYVCGYFVQQVTEWKLLVKQMFHFFRIQDFIGN